MKGRSTDGRSAKESNSFIEAELPGESLHNTARLLFLRDLSTPSLLIEQGLKRAEHTVVTVQYAEQFRAEFASDPFDLVIFDYSLPISDRLELVRYVRNAYPPVPVVLVFGANADREVAMAASESVSECVIRDKDGAYLFKIPDIVAKLLRDKESSKATGHRTTPSLAADDITDRIDLSAIAKQVVGAANGTQKSTLVVLAGTDVGAVVQIDDPMVLIGRDDSCHMVLKDDSISRFHASLKVHPSGVVTIRDLNSTNGTFLNGRSVQIEEIKEGDKIVLGKNTVIKYQTQDSIEKSYHDELYFSSTRDELTGLYNRRFCLEKMKTDLSYAKRHGLHVSVLMFDVDHFKNVNDTYGHLVGDAVLSAISETAAATVREEDILGRYGGEEFLVFALDTDLAGAEVLAERLRQKVSRRAIPVDSKGTVTINATISLGVASSNANYDVKQLIAVADEYLYNAKNSGRNCVRSVRVGASR